MKNKKKLSQSVADSIVSMITIDKRFCVGDKLPNEINFSQELNVSRTTLREAVRILITSGILEIQRGKGTFVTSGALDGKSGLEQLSNIKIKAKDLFEMRLIFEPEAAYLAAIRGTDSEIKQIVSLRKDIEQNIINMEDRTEKEKLFHRAIAKATHNEFMNKMVPILFQGISEGVVLSSMHQQVVVDTLTDHKSITDFLEKRNAEGARSAMRVHILHAIEGLEIR